MLLFQLQQLLLPIRQMWPVWLVLALIFLALRFSKRDSYVIWVWRLAAILIVTIVGMRVVLLLAFPYENKVVEIAYDDSVKGLPLYVVSRNGELSVSHDQNSSKFSLSSYDVKNGNVFSKAEYINLENGKEIPIPAVYFRNSETFSPLTAFWSRSNLSIPSGFKGDEIFYFIDSKGVVDARNSQSEHLKIGAYFSQADLYLPQKGNHSVEFIGGSFRSGMLYFTLGPTYRVHDLTGAVRSYPSQFKKIGLHDYELSGSSQDIVDIDMGERVASHSLEVVVLNAQ